MTLSPSFIAKLEAVQPFAKAALRRLHPTVLVDTPREPCTRRCGKCGESWPETAEFFYCGSDGRFHSPCIACIQEQKQEMHATRPCAYPGCPNPRHRSATGKYTSYCEDHLWHKQRRAARTHQWKSKQAHP
jgi:hypothetical protein